RVLAAASRKGRFALDSELKKQDFTPITIPEGYKGIPSELLTGLEERLETIDQELADIGEQKSALKKQYTKTLRDLTASYSMASAVEALKGQLRSTNSAYVLSGWVPADKVDTAVEDLEQLTGGRVAVLSYNPDEVEDVREGKEKVPVSLRHGSFVRGFEGVVFSYGAPLYGTIDPTPFVAFFFALLFGIMFGDLGQGFVLFLLGFLAGKHGLPFFARFRKYSTPLIAVGIASMVMGLLDGEVFANEHLLVQPTRAVTEFLTGKPMDRIISLMPEKGSIDKLFIFFGFTIAVGAILNSIGLVINIINQCSLKRYDKAFFAKTGLAGTFFFWYAIFIAVRIILGGHFFWADLIGLILPVALIFFGPALWRLISGQRPVLEHGFMVFFMEGFVEILETASTYVSNTVSFLRVGAFALSHAVLSFIVFTMIEMVSGIPGGSVFSLIVAVIGNGIIIVLEGMIVAIQVVRLQYYEFFSKFFTETGVEFNPFRFRKNMDEEAVRKSG
ncbi:V-type ATP synthase subunit I, partial [Treponema sp. OttesenSCG-928-L16]|nr:V-type ATP synthase subunit I [Treponema sp. OttesenSCG-928-L16]